jgi:D-alanine-D-alanine ligase
MKVAIIYNAPETDRYSAMGESKAELGVMDEVRAVSQALAELRYSAVLVPLSPPLEQVKPILAALDADVVFNLFEGFAGIPETEGQLAAMLDDLHLHYTGCTTAALALALDKVKTKELMAAAGIPTPRFQVLAPENIDSFNLPYPCIIKPVAEDASHGLSEDSVVEDFRSLKKQVAKISALFGGRVMVEEFLDGREFNTLVIGHRRLLVPAVSEIVYTLPPGKPSILTFEAKWEESSLYFKNTQAVCPANISPAEKLKITRIAKAAFRLTGCRGYARVDFRQDRRGNFAVLEINPNPDISPGAGASLQIAAAGMSYRQFIDRILHFALK